MCTIGTFKQVISFFTGLLARVRACRLSKCGKGRNTEAPCVVKAKVEKLSDGSFLVIHTIQLHVNDLTGFEELAESDEN